MAKNAKAAPSRNAVAVREPSKNEIASMAHFENVPTGLENVTTKDLLIPRLTILQELSPQLNEDKPEYIDGATVAMICDTAAGKVWEKIEFIPVYYARIFLEWAPRKSGDGLVANHGMDESILKKAERDERDGKLYIGDNILAETATYYGLNVTNDFQPSFIPLTSTNLKISKRWMNAITGEKLTRADGSKFAAPLFYRSWLMDVATAKNNQGEWGAPRFAPGTPILELDPSKKLLQSCIDFHDQAKNGIVQGDFNKASAAENAGDEEETPPARGKASGGKNKNQNRM